MASTPTRRDFLTASVAGLACAAPALAQPAGRAERLILINLVGGPSQLDTFDPKPDAPTDVRGPFASIATRTPGVRFCEHLPKLAALSDRFALVRSLYHDEVPIHEAGLQLLHTGRYEPVGVPAALPFTGPRIAVLPGPIGATGVSVPHGQPVATRAAPSAGAADARYGRYAFARHCDRARRLVEAGTSVVVVNMFTTVFHGLSWDCHADGTGLPTTLDDYAAFLCPMLDQALSALLLDLDERGLLETTLVAAVGEFGRTPKLNPRGGRDHWTGAWSALLAGGGIRGGAVVGATDATASVPVDRPVSAAEFHATLAYALGLPTTANPVTELF